ncbi:pyridoxal phosphate phosphatase PHOSPHO2-like [Zerene cesonia]|uniref:pyridoxal phosphate phosphatase PHOSPHO2-like n=1 Tax=Zerene cesonia TaxID=33412 RepID=UPI0018E55137|nr:pyridoxal phosphate phosphatase PHOSPHO2-like [Zerene cesonia]
MANLAVFDFDRTIVDEDSDATIINRLREKKPPPEWDSGNCDWTPYMSDVFEHAYSAGFHPDDILDSIASMRPTRGMPELIRTLSDRGWDVVLLTDANTVFVGHWLKTHGLEDAVTSVITNRAFWQHGRLYIEPCMRQSGCRACPANLCKSRALAQWCATRHYTRLVYAGDGRNDFCPATSLPSDAIVFPRKGYPLDDLIKKTLATPEPKVKAKVVPWVDGFAILAELFPTS